MKLFYGIWLGAMPKSPFLPYILRLARNRFGSFWPAEGSCFCKLFCTEAKMNLSGKFTVLRKLIQQMVTSVSWSPLTASC